MTGVPQPGGRERIARAIDRARRLRRRVLVSVAEAIAAPEDVLAVVERAAQGGECFVWERPAAGFAVAGLGALATVTASGANRFADVQALCRDMAGDVPAPDGDGSAAAPIFVGGFGFAPDPTEDPRWAGFPPARMTVPRVLILRRGDRATLVASALVDERSDPEEVGRRLRSEVDRLETTPVETPDTGSAGSRVVRYEPPEPPLSQWKQAVADTVADIECGRVEKAVLARVCRIASTHVFDCASAMRRLRRAHASCVLFWIATPQGSFLGATPEPLVSLRGGAVRTAAVAGSTAPGTCDAAARVLAESLRRSEKDRAEHAVVVRTIAAALAPLCACVEVAEAPDVLRLENVQHLVTPISGRLSRPRHVLELVERLHPSAAVAGHPRDAALALLQRRERLHRGWYAGPVGWMDGRGEGEFAVAIRSAVVRGAEASLFAGAGIVAGSDPEAELAETGLKLQPLLAALAEA